MLHKLTNTKQWCFNKDWNECNTKIEIHIPRINKKYKSVKNFIQNRHDYQTNFKLTDQNIMNQLSTNKNEFSVKFVTFHRILKNFQRCFDQFK